MPTARQPSDAYTPTGIALVVRDDWRRADALGRRTGRVVPDKGHILELALKRVEQVLEKPEGTVFDAACPSCGRVTRWHETVLGGRTSFVVLCGCGATA